MASTSMTSKGQITIPKAIRDSLGLKPGDKVEFIMGKNREVIFKPINRTVDDVFGFLYREDQGPVSVEEMNQGIRQKLRKDYP